MRMFTAFLRKYRQTNAAALAKIFEKKFINAIHLQNIRTAYT